MDKIKKVLEETQTKNVENQELICKKIIEEIEKKHNIRFKKGLYNGNILNYLNIITTILLIDDYRKYKKDLINLLNEYNINEKGLLLHLLGVINQIRYGYPIKQSLEARERFIRAFSQIPYYDICAINEQMIEVDTKYGKLKVYKYDDFVKNNNIKIIMQNVYLSNYCHSNVEYMKSFYKEDKIITSEIPLLFAGDMYHSYFKTFEGVVDITNNMFFEKNCFDNVIEPKELLNIKTSKLTKEYNELIKKENINNEENIAPVLVLAINNKIKNIRKN
ncbi:MAG: hypothetical protein E7170_03820 [Firmicutes bacterium]|nr:hypothetical protein [Bacillota bacterium]